MSHPPSSATPAGTPRVWLESHIDTIRTIVWRVARARRVPAHERDDLLSLVYARLVRDDYRALRQFRGDSRITTYLTILTRRLLIDAQVAGRGKWRPSSRARALGAHAIALERRIVRDEVPLAMVLDRVRDHEDSGTLTALARDLHARRSWLRRRFVSLDDVDTWAPLAMDPFWQLVERARAEQRARVRASLRTALADLPRADRHLLAMRYVEGLAVSEIARRTRADQRRLYRRLAAITRGLRARLVGVGVTPEQACDSLGGTEPARWRLT